MTDAFSSWTGNRELALASTNNGSRPIAFQTWHHFKEAFAPELIKEAASRNKEIGPCLDPFGGSGTTALACQFLGIPSTTVEVNPFLADVVEAKLERYDSDLLVKSLGEIVRLSSSSGAADHRPGFLPPTFVEPGSNDRFLFSRDLADEIFAMRWAIESLAIESHRRLFRVLLGGLLVGVSNARVNGKGRRYRSNWTERQVSASDFRSAYTTHCQMAISEIHRFSSRPTPSFEVIRGDARSFTGLGKKYSMAVFSPPYPNSFDYTDVYNVELWMLGYLDSMEENRSLRRSTLSSHVQIKREYPAPPTSSKRLATVISDLRANRSQMWNGSIPEMVGAYFADMLQVVNRIRGLLTAEGRCWMVVGDSRYAGVHVPTASILADLVDREGWEVEEVRDFRSMRSSAQQGGKIDLSESLLILRP